MLFFVRTIIDYFKSDFNVRTHIIAGIILTVCIVLNYNLDFYKDYLNANQYKEIGVVYLFIFYSLPFLVITFLSIPKSSNRAKYIFYGLLGMFLISIDSNYYLMKFVDLDFIDDRSIKNWSRYLISNCSSFLAVLFPLLIIYMATTIFKPERFGTRLNGAKALPYFWLILCMIPLLYLASFSADFLNTYPTYRDYNEYTYFNVNQWVTVAIYELCYGIDFISVEVFYRGFMVIALSKIVGKEAILPMVVIYCFLHFGKPMGEAISSIFGGYILGILAYRTRNIYGGLIVHLGVAWGMEFFAYLQIS